jgi:tetratricopeptide (TPR) repeat protein
VVTLYPEFAYAYFGTAMVYVARGDLAIAEEVLRQGLGVQERNSGGLRRFPASGLHWLLGLVRLGLGDVATAHAEFDRELTSRGSEIYAWEYAMDAYDGHGFAQLAQGDAATAEAMFLKAIDIYSDHARSLVGLAEARRCQGHDAGRRDALNQALHAIRVMSGSGRTTEAAMATAFWHMASGRQEDGLAVLAQLLDEAPPGFAGWTIPIEPLLATVRGTTAYQAALRRLAERTA